MAIDDKVEEGKIPKKANDVVAKKLFVVVSTASVTLKRVGSIYFPLFFLAGNKRIYDTSARNEKP